MHLHLPVSACLQQSVFHSRLLVCRQLHRRSHIRNSDPALCLHLVGEIVKNSIQFLIVLLGDNDLKEIHQLLADASLKHLIQHLQLFLLRNPGMFHQFIKLRVLRQNRPEGLNFLLQLGCLVLTGLHRHLKQGLTVCL